MTLWLYLHFPALQLDTLYRTQHELPIVIVDGRNSDIVQLNETAQAQGIKKGMGLGTAASLCRDLCVYPYDPEIEKSRLLEAAQWLYLVTSDIAFYEPDGLLLKVSHMLTLHHGLAHYWQTLQAHINRLQLRYQYATGCSPLAARLFSRAGLNQVSDNSDGLSSQLKRYPLTATDLPLKTIDKLARVGIHQVADLLTTPLSDIATRFDSELVSYLGRLTGDLPHPVDFYHPPESFKRYLELLFDIENVQWLQKPLAKLLEQLETFLKLRDQLAHELKLSLHQRDSEDCIVTITSAQGDYQAEKWLRLSQLTLERISLNAPVTGLTLETVRFVARTADEGDLFAGKRGALSSAELISLLQAKLGTNSVTALSLSEDYRPERACLPCAPLTSTTIPFDRLRPSLLLPHPQRLTEKVKLMMGPERIVTGWWDHNDVVRDYFIARSEQGRWLWVFRTPQQQWFLHGVFS